MEAVANDLYICDSDEAIQKRCEDREEYLRNKQYVEDLIKSLTSENETLASENETLSSEIDRLRAILKAHDISEEDI